MTEASEASEATNQGGSSGASPQPTKRTRREAVLMLRGYFPEDGVAICKSEEDTEGPVGFRKGPVAEGNKCYPGQTYLMDAKIAKKLYKSRVAEPEIDEDE